MKTTFAYVKKFKYALFFVFVMALFYNFAFSLLYLAQDIGFTHYRSIVDNFKVIAVVPRNTEELEIKLLEEKLYTSSMARNVNFVSSEQAWMNLNKDSFIDKNFKKYSDKSLPHTFTIQMEYVKAEVINDFLQSVKNMDGVKEVLYDKLTLKWIGILQRYLNFSYYIFLGASGIMLFILILFSALYFMQREYKSFLRPLSLLTAAGVLGGIISFAVSFNILAAIGPDTASLDFTSMRYVLFAALSSFITGSITALFAGLIPKEARK